MTHRGGGPDGWDLIGKAVAAVALLAGSMAVSVWVVWTMLDWTGFAVTPAEAFALMVVARMTVLAAVGGRGSDEVTFGSWATNVAAGVVARLLGLGLFYVFLWALGWPDLRAALVLR